METSRIGLLPPPYRVELDTHRCLIFFLGVGRQAANSWTRTSCSPRQSPSPRDRIKKEWRGEAGKPHLIAGCLFIVVAQAKEAKQATESDRLASELEVLASTNKSLTVSSPFFPKILCMIVTRTRSRHLQDSATEIKVGVWFPRSQGSLSLKEKILAKENEYQRLQVRMFGSTSTALKLMLSCW